nr:type IV secretory system conjugative DNA transfer family protein [Streptomyces sp. SID5468]
MIGFLLAVTVLVWTATGLAGLFAHGHWPDSLYFTHTPQAMRQLVVSPKNVAAAWPDVRPADLPGPGLLWGILISELMVLLVLLGFGVGTVSRMRAVRAARRNAAAPPHPPAPPAPLPPPVAAPAYAAGVPSGAPAPTATGTGASEPAPTPRQPVEQAPQPLVEQPPPTIPTGQLDGSYVLFTGHHPDRGGEAVEPVVLAAPGPVVVTCPDARLWERTAAGRAAVGPVHLYDPEHLVDAPERLRWAPHSGCEDPSVATARARALLAPLRTHDVTANDAAATLLRCWLHAAAVDGLPFRQLHRWAAGSGAAEPVRILRTAREAASGWSGELEATLHAHPERRDTAQEAVRQTLAGLNSVHIRDACTPARGDRFELESFVRDRGTLYVVGEPREDPRSRPGAMPLLTALVSSVVEHGRRMAAGSSPGRLDPPMTCALDQVAALAPLPELPGLMGQGPALGIVTLAVLRSQEQARHRWPTREAPSIWRTATACVTADG